MNDLPDRPELDYQPADAFRRERAGRGAEPLNAVRERYDAITRGPFKRGIDKLTAELLFGVGIILVAVLAWLCVLLLDLITG